MKTAVFAGSFDPPTIGHKQTIDTALKIFDKVVVAIMINADKKPFLGSIDRYGLLDILYIENDRVEIVRYDGALVDLLKEKNTNFFIRGIRNSADCEYENMNFYANKDLDDSIIEIYLPCPKEYLHISSSLVRNLIHFKKDYGKYVPTEIYDSLKKLVERKNEKEN